MYYCRNKREALKIISNVFVYGTLMTGMHNHYLIEPYLKQVKVAITEGILYDLPYGYPAMVVGKGVVYGELMELHNIEKALADLDNLEDYNGPDNPNNLYDRVIQEVEITNSQNDNQEIILAYVYLWANPKQLNNIGQIIPTGIWKEKVLKD